MQGRKFAQQSLLKKKGRGEERKAQQYDILILSKYGDVQ